MNIQNCHLRLHSLWGQIDRQHNELIADHVAGKRVLDVGCGYGALVHFLQSNGYDAEGIDFSEESVAVGRSMFPGGNIKVANAEKLEEYQPGSFDTIVLKDCLHHLVGEGDVHSAFRQFRRILNERGRIVILDPNPQPILRLARKFVFHRDPEASPEIAQDLLVREGFSIQGLIFYEMIGLPLSGGYVGPRFVPNVAILNASVARLNRGLSHLTNRIGWGKQLCWRYLLYGTKVGETD